MRYCLDLAKKYCALCARFALSLLATSFITLLLYASNSIAETGSERIDRVKAAFVINIARFVKWPPQVFAHEKAPLMLCLYRNNPINAAIETIDGRKVSGREIRVIPIQALIETEACHIMLIGSNELAAYTDALQTHASLNQPVLTIADMTDADVPNAAQQGVLVALIRSGPRIGFQINLQKSRQVGLKMSSKLLKLATIVGEGG